MANKSRIGVIDPRTEEWWSTTAYVVEAKNHLLQMRQFAYDGRRWFYQPDNRSRFQEVNPRDLPEAVVAVMASFTGISAEKLRERD
jgi:hypothetical protein